MLPRIRSAFLACILIVALGSILQKTAVASSPKAPQNIIVLICDGCGYNHVDAASIYQYGQTGTQVYKQFPVHYAMSTYSGDGDGYDLEEAWTWFDYVKQKPTDSAAAATAMATGVKTYDAAIGVGMNQEPLKNIVERAEKLGKATGVITMVEGGAVDRASHFHISGRMIEEEIDFNQSVEFVADWVDAHSSWDETLVMVTGDHECGYLTGPDSGPDRHDPESEVEAVWNPLVNNGQGYLPGMEWHSGSHTNALIPLYAKGLGSELFESYADELDPVRGEFTDNTEIGQILFRLWTETTGVESFTLVHGVPKDFSLGQNYPNPFNPTTTIAYDLPKASDVTLTIYTIMGQEVAVLVDAYQQAGHHRAMLDGSGYANGVYLYRLEAGSFVETKRMILLK